VGIVPKSQARNLTFRRLPATPTLPVRPPVRLSDYLASMRWTPTQMDRLENAARKQLRVALMRRGTEYIVTAQRVTTVGGREALIGHLPMTGENLTFRLDDVDEFQIIGD
jgi:hypothetical protein